MGNCSIRPNRGLHGLLFSPRVLWIREVTSCLLFENAATISSPDVQSNVPLSNIQEACYGCLQNAQYASANTLSTVRNCAKWWRQQWRRPRSLSASFSTSVSWSLRSCPSQTEECINCSAEFPSVFVDDFPRGLSEGCFFFLLFFPTSSVCCVASSERSLHKVWLSAELSSRQQRGVLGSFAWWGEMPISAQASRCTAHQGCFPFN